MTVLAHLSQWYDELLDMAEMQKQTPDAFPFLHALQNTWERYTGKLEEMQDMSREEVVAMLKRRSTGFSRCRPSIPTRRCERCFLTSAEA